MKTIIAGSRNGIDINTVRQAMTETPFKISEIVSGTAKGVDLHGEKIGMEFNLPIHRFPADWNNLEVEPGVIKRNRQGNMYNALAGHNRNREMALFAEALVAVWDGKSKGTKNMIDTMKKMGKPVFVFKVKSN